jgi:hypothetical protein
MRLAHGRLSPRLLSHSGQATSGSQSGAGGGCYIRPELFISDIVKPLNQIDKIGLMVVAY